MLNQSKNWFYKKSIVFYDDASNTFSGMGNVLVEGNALLMHTFGILNTEQIVTILNNSPQNDLSNYQDRIRKFHDNILKTGLVGLKIAFFAKYSTSFTIENSLRLIKILSEFLDTLCLEYRVFSSWDENADDWKAFISDEHVSFVIASTLNVYNENDVQYEFLYDTCKVKKIQVCLIEYLEFVNLGMYSFLIYCDKNENRLDFKADIDAQNRPNANNLDELDREHRDREFPRRYLENEDLRIYFEEDAQQNQNNNPNNNGIQRKNAKKSKEIPDNWEQLDDPNENVNSNESAQQNNIGNDDLSIAIKFGTRK